MQASRKDLTTILKKVEPALSTKGIIEEMGFFMLKDRMIYGYNDKICIGHQSPVEGIECGVPATELMKILQGMPDEFVEIKHHQEKQLLHISGDTVRAKLKTITSTLVESIPDPTENTWHPLPDEFLDAVQLCLFSASKDMSVSYLNCLWIDGNTITSTDNYRISRYEMEKEMPEPFLLPLSSAIELVSIGGFVEYSLSEGWAFFRAAGDAVIFCSRRVEEECPDTSALFDIKPADEFILPLQIKDGITVCDIMTEKESLSKRIEVSLMGTEVICKGEGTRGWVEHRVAGCEVPEGISFDVNPAFLFHILDHTTTVQIADGKLIFRADQFIHIMALPEK